MSITASIWGANLGDTLWVTPLARYEPGLVVEMLGNDARSRATAPILEHLCEVRFVDKTTETHKSTTSHNHVTQRILEAHGHGGKPSVPRVILTAAEIQWAIEFLHSKGVSDPRHSIAFTNHNSGSGDATNHRARYVRANPEVVKHLAAFWAQGGRNKVLQFGPDPKFYDNDPFDPLHGAIHIRGLSVRQLAACYHVIGRFVGSDSGDYHLMLAVGGKALCMVPRDSASWGYRHYDLLYDEVCWGGELPRVRYCLHEKWHELMSTSAFDSIPPLSQTLLS